MNHIVAQVLCQEENVRATKASVKSDEGDDLSSRFGTLWDGR